MGGYRGRLLTATLFGLILIVAVFFRFTYLASTPPGLYPDEATNGVDALTAIESGEYKFYYPANNGREGLFMNLQAAAVRLLGNEPWVLRAVSGLFGVLAVAGLFFLTKLLWGARAALIASYLMAVSFWAVNFSRIGFRANMLPAILVWSFYFLWIGFRRQKSWAFLVGGLIFGVGMHSYISWRIAPLLIAVFFILLLIYRAYTQRDLLKWGAFFVVGAVLAASPLLLYYAQNPEDFIGRAGQVSIFAEDSPVRALGTGMLKTLGMFTILGDGNWRHNFAGRPALFFPIGVAFLIGLVICVSTLGRRREYAKQFLFFWWIILLLPNFLAPEGAPHALRALGALPPTLIMAALGIEWIWQHLMNYIGRLSKEPRYLSYASQLSRIKKELAILGIAFLLLIGAVEAKTYFMDWALRREVHDAFEQRLVDIGEYLETTKLEQKYVIVNEGGVEIEGVPVQAQTIKFISWNERDTITYLTPSRLVELPSFLSSGVVLMTRKDPELFLELARRYPNSERWDDTPFFGIRVLPR